MTTEAVPEPTRAKVLKTVKGGVAAGGLSLAAIAAFVVPWATSMSNTLASTRVDVSAVAAEVKELAKAVDDLGRDSARITALESSRASTDTSLRFLADRLDRIDQKLDRLIERK